MSEYCKRFDGLGVYLSELTACTFAIVPMVGDEKDSASLYDIATENFLLVIVPMLILQTLRRLDLAIQNTFAMPGATASMSQRLGMFGVARYKSN